MEIAIIIISLSAMWIMCFITYKLLWLIKELAKIIKSDNLQEYIMDEWKPNNKVNIWQQEERYVEVDALSNQVLTDINPEDIYRGVFWTKPKKEHFNW